LPSFLSSGKVVVIEMAKHLHIIGLTFLDFLRLINVMDEDNDINMTTALPTLCSLFSLKDDSLPHHPTLLQVFDRDPLLDMISFCSKNGHCLFRAMNLFEENFHGRSMLAEINPRNNEIWEDNKNYAPHHRLIQDELRRSIPESRRRLNYDLMTVLCKDVASLVVDVSSFTRSSIVNEL
jgi:hypothetical protein